MADQLVTIAQVKARIEVTDATDDTVLTELVEQVSDYVQLVTGRRFIPEAGATYVCDTGAGGVIYTPRGIRAVTAIGIASSDQPDTGGTYTAVTAGLWVLRPSALNRRPGWPATSILVRGSTGYGAFGSWLNGATVTGDWGFLAVPPVIQAITIDAVAAAFTDRMSGASEVIGADGSPVGSWSTFFDEGSAAYRTLQRFRAGYAMGIG